MVFSLKSAILGLSGLVALVTAHTHLHAVTINGEEMYPGECLRFWGEPWNSPVLDISGKEMKCGHGGANPGLMTCPVKAGTEMSIRYYSQSINAWDRVISGNHFGPCQVYMAPAESNGEGDVWFKIYKEDYDHNMDLWCTQKLRETNGLLNFTLPKNIPSGKYLIRGELITLQAARGRRSVDPKLGAQLYIDCVQVDLEGGNNNAKVPAGVRFPGEYEDSHPGLYGNYIQAVAPNPYPFPGPPVFDDKTA
ncbi:hypothetical protein H4219_004575 [Mycoemilia scoparia]|uniref:lytic cellulose monooxygenase (C4-dehydrogenating) n=1 Tax=Mycoemilia scoparia TaxID=417184 RepID=A0A9W7ZR73_9FUNG|nr:hypothetical protein H4219_004575 [Mycoemilia scoparia]